MGRTTCGAVTGSDWDYSSNSYNVVGSLKCEVVEEKGIESPYFKGKYEARAECSGKGYQMTDCNSYVDREIDQCTKEGYQSVGDNGVNWGGTILPGQKKEPHQCFAAGNTPNIIAQAVCCKVA